MNGVQRKLLSTAVVAAVVLTPVLAPGVAAAASGSGGDGQRLTATPSSGLNPAGASVKVTGSGYDETKGIYVAICFDQGAGKLPTPCLGGADTSGSEGASAWISSNPPSYGKDLAKPFGKGGTFGVTLRVDAVDPVTGYDCRDPAAHAETAGAKGCAIVTRADHTRSSDRSADVRIPVTFTGSTATSGSAVSTTGPAAPNRVPSTTQASTGGAAIAGATPAPTVISGRSASGDAEAVATPQPATGWVSADGETLSTLPVSSGISSSPQAWVFVGVCALAVLLTGVGGLRRRRNAKAVARASAAPASPQGHDVLLAENPAGESRPSTDPTNS